MTSTSRIVAVLLLVSITAVACSDDAPPVEFGEGEVPSGFPGDFPIPDGAEIGSTLTDRTNTRSEFSMRVPLSLSGLTQFFSVNLVSEGYVIASSTGTQLGWTIDFTRGDLRGSLVMKVVADDVSTVVAEINNT